MAGQSRRSAARNRRRVRRQRRQSSAEKREWMELPRDVLTLILRKVGGIDVLRHAQAVCHPWLQLALDPEFWRIIDMRGYSDLFYKIDLEGLNQIAVDWSGGLVEELYLDYFGCNNFLGYIVSRSTRLRPLDLTSNHGISQEEIVQFVTHCPLLEELQLTNSCFFAGDYKAISHACPRLKCFRLNGIWYNLDDDLRSKLAKIKDVKLPNDSIAGYEFQTRENENIFGEEYISGDSDPGLTYGDSLEYGTDFSCDDFTVLDYFDGYDDNAT